MDPRFTAIGSNGQFELYDHFLMMTRNDNKGGKFFFLKALSGLNFRVPDKMPGYLQVFASGFEERSYQSISKDAVRPNSVEFGTKEMASFKELLDLLLKETASMPEKVSV